MIKKDGSQKVGKFLLVILLEWLTIHNGFSQTIPDVIPRPLKYAGTSGKELFIKNVRIVSEDPVLENVRVFMVNRVGDLLKVPVSPVMQKATLIRLSVVPGMTGPEGYQLVVSGKGIHIKASSPNGIFYGLQTLFQLIHHSPFDENGYHVGYCEISDEPRYRWRGFMLDESRHFFGKEKVKQILDLMAVHKLNRFHWHLTDSHGWRIEIGKYPELTRTGAKGNFTDPEASPQFYTREDIAGIVRYAADRFITVIPEIDMPGHASAAVRAYPFLSGGGSKEHPDFTFNPGRQTTYNFLSDVLKVVALLFPSPIIHVGGDEVNFGNEKWETDPDVMKLREKHGLNNLKEVEKYFIRRIADTLFQMNKNLAGWDEIVQSGIPTGNSLVMWWRHDKPEVLKEALSIGYQVVLCPRLPLYFDFDQQEPDKTGRKWKGSFCNLEDVYHFPESLGKLADNEHIAGIQANLWTERISSPVRVDYLTWPRLSAMAESAWTVSSGKNYPDFRQRLKKMFALYNLYQLYYFDPDDPSRTPEPDVDGSIR